MKSILAFIALLLAALPAPVGNSRVQDFANVLGPATKERLEVLARQVEQETTVQFVIVTIQSLEGESIDTYSTQLFNQWGVGRSGTNNGVAFVIAPDEHRTRIEVGYGVEPLLSDSLCGEILDTEVIPHFKRSEMELGIIAGAERIAQILISHPEAARGVAGSAPAYLFTPYRTSRFWILFAFGCTALAFVIGIIASRKNSYPTTLFISLSILVAAAVLIALYFTLSVPQAASLSPLAAGSGGIGFLALLDSVRRFRRYGPHYCSKCRTKLQLLDEVKDDEKLTDIQKLEEKLGSVDYDVWVCPACLSQDIESYTSWFSGFKNCPQCKHRTFEEKETIVVPATTFSAGQARIDGKCYSCHHTSVRYRVIPRRSSSSSSSGFGGSSSGGGGGFGGGSSGGGGSSRSW